LDKGLFVLFLESAVHDLVREFRLSTFDFRPSTLDFGPLVSCGPVEKVFLSTFGLNGFGI
jgi:hypothetical protein